MFTKPLTRAPRYILIKAFFLAVALSYLLDLSRAFLKRLKLLWGEIAFQTSSLSTDNGQTSMLSSFHRISTHPNISRYLDTAITDCAETSKTSGRLLEEKALVNDFGRTVPSAEKFMASFRCHVNSGVIVSLIRTNFHLYLVQLWW